MATTPKTKRFFEIVNKINNGQELSDDDYTFFVQTVPDIDQKAIDDYAAEEKRASSDPKNPNANPEILQRGLIESYRQLQASPEHKERLAKLAEDNATQKLNEKVSTGLDLILKGTDIASSLNQIRTGKQASAANKRPGKPAVPQRDMMLAQALRKSQEGTFDTERAVAPLRAEINDQYLNDIQNAKTASTGQAGAFGTYAQLAANRRNRAALGIAPIQDQIRREQQSNQNDLLGMRMNETQRMFDNNSQFYNNDLDLYKWNQQNAGNVIGAGRQSLRNSLYNFAGSAAPFASTYYTQQRYNRLKNQASAAGMNPELAANVHSTLDGYVNNDFQTQQENQPVFDYFNSFNPYQ